MLNEHKKLKGTVKFFRKNNNKLSFRYELRVSDGYFHYNPHPKMIGWYHLGFIYHGPNNTQGISVYHNGTLIWNDTSKALKIFNSVSTGTVVIGKLFTNHNNRYGSVMVDELTFWDKQRLPEEIQAMAELL